MPAVASDVRPSRRPKSRRRSAFALDPARERLRHRRDRLRRDRLRRPPPSRRDASPLLAAASRRRATACRKSRDRRCGSECRARRRSRMNRSSSSLGVEGPDDESGPADALGEGQRQQRTRLHPRTARHPTIVPQARRRHIPPIRQSELAAVSGGAGEPSPLPSPRATRNTCGHQRFDAVAGEGASAAAAISSSSCRPTPSSRCCRSRSAASALASMMRLTRPFTMMAT